MGGDGGGSSSILPPEEEQKPSKPKDHIFTKGCSVEVLTEDNGFKGVFFTATVIEPSPISASSRDKLHVQYHNLLADEGGPELLVEQVDVSLVRPEPPSSQERVEGFEVGEVVDAFHNDGWWIGVVTRLVGGGESRRRFTVSFSHPREERDFWASDLRPHWDWVDGAWVKPEKQVRPTPRVRRSSRGTERCHSPQSRVSSPPRKRRMLRSGQQDQIDRTIITEALTSDGPSPPKPIRRKRRRVGEKEVTETTERVKVNEDGIISSRKRRPGRPRKNSDQLSSRNKKGRPRKNTDQISSEKKRKGRPRKNSFKATGERTIENVPEVEGTANTSPNSKFSDNGSLLMSVENMQSRPKIACKSPNHGNTEEIRIERYKDHTNGEILQEDGGNNLENNQEGNASLPFVKTNNLWKIIESMDVFKRIPQSPHFMQLKKFGECSREGLAIGLMITFSNVVDKVSKLRLSDPQSVMADILGSLADLESHGFDVRKIRKRVNDILAVKDEQRDCLEEEKKVDNELVMRRYEKMRNCEEIDGMKRQILLAESANVKAEDDIVSLESKRREVKEVIKKVESDFSKLVNEYL